MSKEMPWFFRAGMRKVTVLGPAILIAELSVIGALFAGKLTPESFESALLGVLSYGCGIMAGANVLEHFARARAPKSDA